MTIIDMRKVDPSCQNVGRNEGAGNITEYKDKDHLFPHEACLLRVCTAGHAYGMS